MSALRRSRLLAIVAMLAVLAGCATNRILRCEGHLVPINPPPPKPVMAVPAPARDSPSARTTEKRP